MRSAARAARDAAVPAIDLRGVIGAATGLAASLVEVSVMLPNMVTTRMHPCRSASAEVPHSSKTPSAQIAAHQALYYPSVWTSPMVSLALHATN